MDDTALATILGLLREQSEDEETSPIGIHDLRGRVLAPGVVRVSWDSSQGDRRARRTSIWCEREPGWQQVHHQGTPLSPDAPVEGPPSG